ncbi:DUF2827 family protein, partial [Caballeronia sp. GAFFF2]|uniref:DUF2827 family protein n=1 Tax=Caballeronia sp. GAFFF2 TaxID=2921741 RepID=UPI002029398D
SHIHSLMPTRYCKWETVSGLSRGCSRRFDTPTFLAQNTDIVISHQWENPLNYFYLEVCWQGYPLVHNATLCPDLGYFYHANNLTEGASMVIEAIDCHDQHLAQYRHRQRSAISRFLPSDDKLVASYTELLESLMQQSVR